jgi:hypothetical protein
VLQILQTLSAWQHHSATPPLCISWSSAAALSCAMQQGGRLAYLFPDALVLLLALKCCC